MNTVKLLGLMFLAAFVGSGCAAVAHVEKDETVNFSKYKTFAWTETSDSDSVKQKISYDLTESNFRAAITAELQKQGWREGKASPDVLLAYDVLVERAIRDDNNPMFSRPFTRYMWNPYSGRWVGFFYPSQFMGYWNNSYEVREGTVTITMVDAATDKTIWQGWTTKEVGSRNLTRKEIQTSVKNIFRKFDIAKR